MFGFKKQKYSEQELRESLSNQPLLIDILVERKFDKELIEAIDSISAFGVCMTTYSGLSLIKDSNWLPVKKEKIENAIDFVCDLLNKKLEETNLKDEKKNIRDNYIASLKSGQAILLEDYCKIDAEDKIFMDDIKNYNSNEEMPIDVVASYIALNGKYKSDVKNI